MAQYTRDRGRTPGPVSLPVVTFCDRLLQSHKVELALDSDHRLVRTNEHGQRTHDLHALPVHQRRARSCNAAEHMPLITNPGASTWHTCRLMIMYSEPLAHMLYAAADFVIVPSLFEPCGLTQMIAMRYGALPVVRRTGGLADTVSDADEDTAHGTGFVFDGADEGSCAAALDRSFRLFKEDRARWDKISRQNMDSDMSWRKAGEAYLGLYRSVMHE